MDDEREEDVSGMGDSQHDVITTSEQCQELCKSPRCLVELEKLKVLARIRVDSCSTADCTHLPKMETKFIGSALYFKWVYKYLHYLQ